MRKVSTLVGLTVLVLSGAARAQEEAPAAAPAADSAAAPAPADAAAAPAPEVAKTATAASDTKMQLGVNLLPMLLGKTKTDAGSNDMSMAYGVGVSFGYAVIPGLYVGVAPQALFRVNGKPAAGTSAKAYDLLARVAYVYTVAPKVGVYAEVLPGYSIVSIPDPINKSAKGFVIAGGVGANYDVTDQVYLNLGVGYQYGLQKVDSNKSNLSYLRIAVGAGARF